MKRAASLVLGLLLALAAALFAAPAAAQTSPSPYTTGHRYDATGRETGTISPDPDGAGSLKYAATRTTYDARGNPTKVESGELSSWKAETVAPAAWTGFTVLSSVETTYDALDRKLSERVKGSGGTTVSLTQYSYDSFGRLECTAVRMNPAEFASPPASACTLDTEGSNGPDRITRNLYDDAGQLVQVRRAVGTSLEQAYATYAYTPNGKQEYVIDANGNRAKLEYDGHDRQAKWIFPSASGPSGFNPATPATALSTAGSVNTADYELYGYDANGNRTSLRKRDGIVFAYTYDALGRMTLKNVPTRPLPGASNNLASTYTRDVYYSYDLSGNPLKARFDSLTGEGVTDAWDGFGHHISSTLAMDSKSWTLTYQYDDNGNRTRITHPDGAYFQYAFDGLNRLVLIENSAGNDLVAPSWNTRGLLAGVTRLSSAHDQAYSYDSAGRLSGLDLAGGQSSSEVAWSVTRNAASQVLTSVRDNDDYAWGPFSNVTRSYETNGLNQYVEVSNTDHCSDANGNLIWDGTWVYIYDAENRLVEKRQDNNSCPDANNDYTGSLVASLRYDPLGRLYEYTVAGGGGGTTRFVYDGDALVAEYSTTGSPSGTGALQRRYVHGSDAGADDPLLWFENTTSTASSNARHLYADRLGSIVLVGSNTGSAVEINAYDEYGVPDSNNEGRFQYTGQIWLPGLDMYHYKARIYHPGLGRFMQTDPVGYEDQVNLYAYVGNDPVNGTDPTGMRCESEGGQPGDYCDPEHPKDDGPPIVVPGRESAASVAASMLIPGWDFGVCVVQGCNAVDWAFAAADIVPAAKVLKIRKIGKIRKLFKRACGCFAAGTLVATPDGLVAIETIKVGDLVMGYDEATGSIAAKTVTDLIRPEPKPLYELSVRDVRGEEAVFFATDDHPWKVEGKGWAETAELQPSQRIETAQNGTLLIDSITLTDRIEATYNLTVDGWHTFLVGENGAIVHNACDPNKLRHIFGQPKHKLDGVLKAFGNNEEAAFGAIEDATSGAVRGVPVGETFKVSVEVAGENITVTGIVTSAGPRIGTAFVP